MLDPEACYRALRARDERFDGRFFVAITTTGIYCRPVCPARPAKAVHCRFFPSAAAAQEAGFRPCLRCRPETAPDTPAWRAASTTVSRGLSLIAEGELDGEGTSVDALAERLGVGERQLRRLFQQHLGASPIAVAQTRRVLFAKHLLHETQLPMSEVAFAAGFGSVRRFNEVFRALYERPPSALRRPRRASATTSAGTSAGVTVKLRYRAPYDWQAMLHHLRTRAIDGVERVEGDRYVRTATHGTEVGVIEIAHLGDEHSLAATLRFPSVRGLSLLVTRIRRMFDVGADLTPIRAHLSEDPLLAPLVMARPGLRVPGAFDGFELAVRAILGQQISVEAARRLAAELVRLCGRPIATADRETALGWVFPSPAAVASADLSTLPMPAARQRALVAIARAALDDPQLFSPLDSVEDTVARLSAIRGVGPWTASTIAMRAAREPDAFPATDAGLLRGAATLLGARPSVTELSRHAERWRPWRAYAAQHLWAAAASPPSKELS